LDGKHSEFFLIGLQYVRQRATKCIEFRGEYIELVTSLAAVPFFLHGRAKGLSAPPRTYESVKIMSTITNEFSLPSDITRRLSL
jgi:hypothetical protein